MRDFFIKSFDIIITVIIVLMAIAVIVAGFGTMFTRDFLQGLGILVGGAIYVLFMGGALYMMLGVYHNTRRTAEGVEALLRKP